MNFKKIFIGTFLSVLISFILMCILAVLVYFADIQDRTISAIVFGLSSLSVFIGAFFMARNISGRGLISGAILAVLYILFLLILSLWVNGAVSMSAGNFLRMIAGLAAGALGGVLGINTGYKGTV